MLDKTRDQMNSEIIGIVNNLNSDKSAAAFCYAAMLKDEPDPEHADRRIYLKARELQKFNEELAADPDTSADNRSRAEYSAKIFGILCDTLQKMQAAKDGDAQ